ncbi:HdeD family acid-resistance protein [Geodermatophilus sp. SYSU D00708]
MTANVSSPYAAAPSGHKGLRIAVGLLGVAVVVVGIVLLFNPVAAARSLALLLGLAFVVGGLLEIAVGWDAERHRTGSLVLGAVLVIGGILAAFWPGLTLWTLVLITGLSLIVHGAGRVGLAVVARDEIPGWGWLVALGAVNVIVGVLAIVWPQATVLVLCIVFGLQVVFLGLALVAAGFWRSGTERAVPSMG